jgi:NTP pyrophosphatase (non-canonical NTP hydrolase)
MTADLDALVSDIKQVYDDAQQPLPQPRAIALRLLEEAVELALACGASAADVSTSMHDTMVHEHAKHPEIDFHQGIVADHDEIAGELADVALLTGFCQRLAAVADDDVSAKARWKVERLAIAQHNNQLRWTADGRFYRIT